MFNALAPIIIFRTQTPQVFEILDVFLLANAFLGFIWNNSQSLPNFQQHFCNPSFDLGVVICIFTPLGEEEGAIDISLGGKMRLGPPYPDPV